MKKKEIITGMSDDIGQMNQIVTERPNLFEPNVYITVCAEIAGKVCPYKLSAAMKQAFEANEATMSKIVLENGLAYYEKMSVSNCKIEIKNENKNWIELVNQNEKIPFAIDKGELVRVFIIPSEDKTQIVIMAHHLVGDGKSIIYFIKDIMNALSGIPLIYKPLTLLERGLPQKGLPVIAKLYAHYCNHKWDNRFWGWQDYYDMHNKYWGTVSSDIQYKTLSAEETQKIIESAKQIGCSVNSYIVTMFLQKYPKLCKVGIPVSIRQGKNEAMSNLTSGIYINYKYDTQKTFDQNAMQVHKRIIRILKRYKILALQFITWLPMTLMDAVLLNTYNFCCYGLAEKTAKIFGYTEKTKIDLGISNLTVLDIPVSYGKYKIENIIFVPPAVSYSNNIIGVSTINGKMTISYHNITK